MLPINAYQWNLGIYTSTGAVILFAFNIGGDASISTAPIYCEVQSRLCLPASQGRDQSAKESSERWHLAFLITRKPLPGKYEELSYPLKGSYILILPPSFVFPPLRKAPSPGPMKRPWWADGWPMRLGCARCAWTLTGPSTLPSDSACTCSSRGLHRVCVSAPVAIW